VPPAQQGGLWGWIGMAQPLGLVLGVLASTALLPNLPLAAAVMALLLLVSAGPFLGTRALPLRRSHARSGCDRPAGLRLRRRLSQALAAFRHPPFAALWWARFWLYLGWSASMVYLLYFLEDRLGLPRPQALQAQVVLLLLYTAATALAAAWAGQASDRLGRRLEFVWAGSGAMGLAYALILISQSLPLALAGSTLLGLGYGVYVATHQALVVEHLPDRRHHARDLGLFNGANTAPMVVAPALAWLCVTQLGGYSSLFLVCSLLILASNFTLLSCDQLVSRCQHARD
jgi:Na+/melibiose symporter-like transporter